MDSVRYFRQTGIRKSLKNAYIPQERNIVVLKINHIYIPLDPEIARIGRTRIR